MWCLIGAESAIFTIFVVAYLFYIGKSVTGPQPKDVLHPPIFYSICLLSSSLTIHLAVRKLMGGNTAAFARWWLFTILLGGAFLYGTAREWVDLIDGKGLTISTNLFG
ncbi:MAG: heme-copper oxidase subunit III, partial [Alphaproteobacteria bacterium]|nr:heme-copper oxidase subunit III [Alphaproteobacteria bacterium]